MPSAPIRAGLLLVWTGWSVAWSVAQQIVVTKESGGNLVATRVEESAMAGSRARVVLLISSDTSELPEYESRCANPEQLNDAEKSSACATPMRFWEPSTASTTWATVDGFVISDITTSSAIVQNGEPQQLTLILDGGAVQSGQEHMVEFTIGYEFRNYAHARWWAQKWTARQEATITFAFDVQPPNYYVIAVPQGTAVELRAGEEAVRMFTLYNVRPNAVSWRISSDFQCTGDDVIGLGGPTSVGGHAWLAIAPADPLTRSCGNLIPPQDSQALQFHISAPTIVPSNDLTYSLVIDCQDTATDEYTWEEARFTVHLTIDFTVTVRPGYPDPLRSDFEVVLSRSNFDTGANVDLNSDAHTSSIAAGGVLKVEVFARDEFGNRDASAGLYFTMQTSSTDLAGVARGDQGEMGSRFEEGRYLIDSDALLPGVYTVSVSFMAPDGDQSLQIQRDSTGTTYLQQSVAPIVCSDGQIPHPETGTFCIFCGPGKQPAHNGSTCEDCPVGQYGAQGRCATCGYGMTVSADLTSCESCPAFSNPLNSTSGTCVCDAGYIHNETKVGLHASLDENEEDGIRRDENGMHFFGTDCQGKRPCCDACPDGALCRKGSRHGYLTIYPDVGMWVDITGEYLGKPLTVVPCPPLSCPGYCKLRNARGLPDDPSETGCKGQPGVKDWSRHTWAEFDAWIDRHVRGRDPSFPNACKNGASGLVCATCDVDADGKVHKKVEGTCVSCSHFPIWAAVWALLMYMLLCLFFVHKSRRIETGVDCDTHISSSIVGILVFFMQTAMLLPREGLAIFKLKWVAQTFKPVATLLKLWPDFADDESDSCFSTGVFLVDYTSKYFVPIFILGITWGLSRHVLHLRERQVRMGLLFSVQFGLFPVIMHSVSLFFCRDDLREFAGVPKPAATSFGTPSYFSLWRGDLNIPRLKSMPEICTTTVPVPDVLLAQEATSEQHQAVESGCHLDWSPNRLRLDPARECTGADFFVANFSGAVIAIFCTVFVPVQLYRILDAKMKEHDKLLRISMYLKYGIDKGMAMIVNDRGWKSAHSPELAAQDPFSFLYYPLRRQCFWWSIVWIFRPAAIALVYSARDRYSLVAFGLADWRLLAVMILMIYNTVQATVRPFKHLNESQLDATSVLLLMLLFSLSINLDMMRYNIGSDAEDLLGLVSWFGVLMLLTVVAAAVLSKRQTAKHIKRKIARQHWKIAWTNMSAASDPLSQMLDDGTVDAQHWTKRVKHVNTALKMGVRTKLPVFEQIDVDGSNHIDLQEFLQWWHLRTLRHVGKNGGGHIDDSHSIALLAERLFNEYDKSIDQPGCVSRDEFEIILKRLHAQQQENQQKIRDQQTLPVRQAALQQEKQRVLDHISSFARFTVSKATLEEHGQQIEYYRVVDESKTFSFTDFAGLETKTSTNPAHRPRSSFEVEGASAAPVLQTPPRRRDKASEAETSINPAAASGSQSVSVTPTVREIFDEIDADGSGVISFEELMRWWMQHADRGNDARLLPKLEEAYSILEYRDGVAGLSLSEFEEMIFVVAIDDWELTKDTATGREYYVNRITRESSWTQPNKGCIAAFLKVAGVLRTQAASAPRPLQSQHRPGGNRATGRQHDQGFPLVPTRPRLGLSESFVSASAVSESSMVNKIVDATICTTNSNFVLADDFMAFLQAARSASLAEADKLALDRHFNAAFANSSASRRTASPALSIDELRHSLASLVSQDHTKGVDPQSGRVYYVHNRARTSSWVIDAAAIDACLGRIFENI